MFDDPRDVNRDLNNRDLYRQQANMGDTGWGAPIALLAVVIIIGALIAFAPRTNVQTAQTNPNAPAMERTTPPVLNPAPVTPAPRTTAPQQ